jgi:hypothetical protein
MNSLVPLNAEPQPPTPAEIADEMQRSLGRSMEWVIREWRAALLQVDEQQAGSVPAEERDDLTAVRELTRTALDGLERLGHGDPARLDHLQPDEYTWFDITHEMRRDSAAGMALWTKVRQTARDALACGATAGQAIEGYHPRPFERAQFIAIREALADGLQPRNRMEWLLIDGMAQAWMMHLYWLDQHTKKDSLGVIQTERDMRERDTWEPPRLSESEAVERAAQMADRFQRQFLRLMKCYRDGRKLIGSVTMLGGQLNVAEKQVVTTGVESPSS